MGEGRKGFQNLLKKGKNTGVILFSISTLAGTGGRETLKNIFINRFSHSWRENCCCTPSSLLQIDGSATE